MNHSGIGFSGLFLTRRGLLLSCGAVAGVLRASGGQGEQTSAQQRSSEQSPGQPNSSQQPTFSTNVKVVNVFATVRDKDGQVIRNLTKDDFTLEEDGTPQTIQYFSQQSDLPLTLGLLVDTSGSERRMLGTERDASRTFLEQVLRPEKDKAFLIHFDREVEMLQDLTSSRQRLEKALNLIDQSQPQWGGNSRGGSSGGNGTGNDPNDPGNYPGGSGQGGNNGGWGGNGSGGGWGGGRRGGGGRQGRQGGYGGGGTTLYDAIYLASDDVLRKQGGRKAIILLTDGEDTGSKLSMAEAITSTQRADTLAYSVRIADDESSLRRGFGGPGMGGRHGGWGGGGGGMGRPQVQSRPDGKKVLRQISQETGGGYFEVSKKTVEEIYKEIEDELRNQYSIGYTPTQSSNGNQQFRTIRLTVKQKGLIVQSRSGYYPAGGAE